MTRLGSSTLLLLLAAVSSGPAIARPALAGAEEASLPSIDEEARPADAMLPPFEVPDVEVLDQDGRALRFYADLVKDRVVIIQFIFTTCTTICKPLSAVFAQLQSALGPDSDVRLISISVDPATDVPARLKAYAARFHAGSNWTFVTGEKGRIAALLKALGAYTPDKLDHTAFVLAGNDRTGRWMRTYGLASADTLMQKLRDVSGAKDREWFTDLPVFDQQGRRLRFYTDVLEGKIVVINFIFTRCTSICPLLTATMRGVQERISDLVGKEVQLVSISVDPEFDSPEILGLFAERYKVGPGWLFLTGRKENVDWVMHKLGAYTPEKETHSSLFLVGDTVTGRWSKVVGTSPPAEIASLVRTLLDRR